MCVGDGNVLIAKNLLLKLIVPCCVHETLPSRHSLCTLDDVIHEAMYGPMYVKLKHFWLNPQYIISNPFLTCGTKFSWPSRYHIF